MELHVGDVVRLKSGGPEMTVIEFPLKITFGEDNPNYTKCQWFDAESKLSNGTFIVDALEKDNN